MELCSFVGVGLGRVLSIFEIGPEGPKLLDFRQINLKYSTVTQVNRGSTVGLRRSTLDFSLCGQRSLKVNLES